MLAMTEKIAHAIPYVKCTCAHQRFDAMRI